MQEYLSQKQSKILSLGIGLEYLDFFLFASLGKYIDLYFLDGSPALFHKIGELMIPCLSFLCRPIGGIAYGFLADKYSRRIILLVSTWLLLIGSFILCVLPGYATWGILSPIIFFVLRMNQGISMGGEFAVTFTLLHESMQPSKEPYSIAQHNRRKLFFPISLLTFVLVGQLLVMLINQFWNIVPDMWHPIFWRIPILVSTSACAGFFLFRLKILDSIVFIESKVVQHPFKEIWAHYKMPLLILFICMSISNISLYSLTNGWKAVFHNQAFISLPYSEAAIHALMLLGIIGTLVMPNIYKNAIGGFTAYKYSLILGIPICLVMWYVVSCLQLYPNIQLLCVGLFYMYIANTLYVLHFYFMPYLFPIRLRSLGIGIATNMASAIFLGLFPIIWQTHTKLLGFQLFFSSFMFIVWLILSCNKKKIEQILQ
jgi:MFS transporter, MHS family, alpha-ketoglutarate permease